MAETTGADDVELLSRIHEGFGILMAKKLVDELIFSQKGNEVVLIKYLV